MTPTPPDHEKLERLIHRTLRALPARRAPGSLEPRMRAELARRAALPWWRQGFAHWPLAARAAFVVLSAGIVKLVLVAVTWATGGFEALPWRATLARPLAWIEGSLTVLQSIGNFADTILGSIPPLWLYGGIAGVVALYVALFGLGTMAYRTLQADR